MNEYNHFKPITFFFVSNIFHVSIRNVYIV